MYTLMTLETNSVIDIGLTRDQMLEKIDNTMRHLFTSDWSEEPQLGMTTDPKTMSFVYPLKNHRKNELIRLLTKSDWRMGVDYPHDNQQEWIDYRAKIRTMLGNDSKVFPVPPVPY